MKKSQNNRDRDRLMNLKKRRATKAGKTKKRRLTPLPTAITGNNKPARLCTSDARWTLPGE